MAIHRTATRAPRDLELLPLREASRRTRIATAPTDFAFAWGRGDTSARRPRRKA